jgi:hypothetical protein
MAWLQKLTFAEQYLALFPPLAMTISMLDIGANWIRVAYDGDSDSESSRSDEESASLTHTVN